MASAESSSNDLAALDRILLRLSGASNEQLPSILISLIPKLIPLGNNEVLRRKVIEVSTEIIRRVKLGSIKLPLRIFTEVIHATHLPFAPNIGIGLMDAVHSVNCICDVDSEAIGLLLDAALSHQHMTFLSNSILYYLLHYSDKLTVSLLTSLPKETRQHAETIIGDYFLDILLLRDLQLQGNLAGSIAPGLSEKRRARLGLRKRFLDSFGLNQLKINALNYFTRICLDSICPFLLFCAAIIAKCDSENTVALKGIYLLNMINDKNRIIWGESLDTTGLSINFMFHNRGLQCNHLISTERTGLSANILSCSLRELLRNWTVFSNLPPRNLLVSLLRSYSKQEFGGLTSEANERLTILLLELLCVDADLFSKDVQSANESIVPSLVDSVWALLRRFTSTSSSSSGTVSEFRMQTYKLLVNMVQCNVPGIVDDPNLLIELLKLADYDEQSAGTPLHKVLQDLREQSAFQFDLERRQMIAQQLETLRCSQRASSRLLFLQWTKRIFGVTETFLSSLISFCGKNDYVKFYFCKGNICQFVV